MPAKLMSGIIKKRKGEYTESELILPALTLLYNSHSGLQTSDFVKGLQQLLLPTGHDAEIIAGRNDTYFSQKVRNLKSHNTLTKLRLANYDDDTGTWELTGAGRDFVNTNGQILEVLKNQGFRVRDVSVKEKWNFTNIVIEEGSLDYKTVKQRRRSQLLKKFAISEFKKRNKSKVFCTVCSFNFYSNYGKLGKDYIEVHHLVPIHKSDIHGEKALLSKAAKDVALVCSNCHRMIHRRKGQMVSVIDLKSILKQHHCVPA